MNITNDRSTIHKYQNQIVKLCKDNFNLVNKLYDQILAKYNTKVKTPLPNYKEQVLLYAVQNIGCIYIAIDHGRVIGLSLSYPTKNNAAYIAELHVIPQYRSKGIGKLLLINNIKCLSKKYPSYPIEISVAINNRQALQMYIKTGFSKYKNIYYCYKSNKWGYDKSGPDCVLLAFKLSYR